MDTPSPSFDTASLDSSLDEHFGFEGFQPGQREVIEDVMAGKPTIAVMPTGAGKSLCYQLPALLLDGLTIVVSPLIALMKDQVDSLTERGISATFINSSQSYDEQREIMDRVSDGGYRLLYVAPERFRSGSFMRALEKTNVALMAIDEAHCISRWGHDFRPDYGRLGQVVAALRPNRLLACTATATPEVRADIETTLNLDSAAVHVAGFLRSNLHLEIKLCRKDKDREKKALDFIASDARQTGAVIVYASTRRRVERFADACRSRFGSDSVVAYHAGLPDAERTKAQDDFMRGSARIAVATNAFGMGIDRADIRGVVHVDLPRTVEGYYQEVGRAGRDGKDAQCLLLFSPIDRRTHEFLIDLSHPEPHWVESVWSALAGERFHGMSTKELATRSTREITEPQAESALRTLAKAGAANSDIERRWYGHPDAPEDANCLGIDYGEIRTRREREISKLDRMCDLAYSLECRHAQVLGYFGEGFEPSECPGCDRCQMEDVTDTLPLEAEAVLMVRKALAGVARAEGRFGLRKVAGMLAGSRARDVKSTSLGSLTTYGILSSLGAERCADLLQALTDRGLCNMSGGRYPMLTISKAGWSVMQGDAEPLGLSRSWLPKRATKRAKRPGVEVSADAHCPWQTGLRSFRSEEADRRQVPAFVVFSNRTLAELATRRPSDRGEFLEVHGLGPSRWDSYGERLIATIAEISCQIEG